MPYQPTKIKITLLAVLLGCGLYTRAQNKCSCKEAEQLRGPMGFHFNSGRLDSAAFYARKLTGFSNPVCRIFFHDWMAQIALAEKKFEDARKLLHTEKELLQENNCNQELYVRHYNTLSKLYLELNQTDSFVMTCLDGIDASKKVNDYYGLSRANADVASAFSGMGQTEKAIAYYREAIKAAQLQNKVPSLVASVSSRLGNEYLVLFRSTGNKHYADSAVLLGKEAAAIAEKNKDLLAYLEANETLATHAFLSGDHSSSLQYADIIINTSPRGVHLFDRLTNAGFSKKTQALYKLGDYAGAERMADSALLYAEHFNPQMMVAAYENLYLAAKATRHTDRSLKAYEKMVTLRDSLFSIEKNASISELEKKYNQAKNENTIKDLAKKKQLYLLLAVAGILAAVAIGFFLRQQSLKHKKKVLETEQRLNRARMNPHFFFNALTALQKFAIYVPDGQALASNLARFSNIMRETLESTYKEYVTVEQEMEFLDQYLEVQKVRFPKAFTYSINAAAEVETDEVLIPSMIIQPFIENSIEHGFAGISYPGNIVIDFSKDNKELLIEIKDNGKGLSTDDQENSEHISRASQIIKDRIYLLNIKLKSKAGFSIANNPMSEGVIVKIHLPLIYKNVKDA
ncbi:MAG: histidine kinase [Chitinophagaceae bacterium]|nr:histidine kinase [Chitinophagaceae bacterium]